MDEEKPWSLQHYVGEWIGKKNLWENSSLGTHRDHLCSDPGFDTFIYSHCRAVSARDNLAYQALCSKQ